MAVCGVHGRAGLGTPAKDVQPAEDCGNLLLQHEPHQAAVVQNLAGHRRPLQQGQCLKASTELEFQNVYQVQSLKACLEVSFGWCCHHSVHHLLSCIEPLMTQIYYRHSSCCLLANFVYLHNVPTMTLSFGRTVFKTDICH